MTEPVVMLLDNGSVKPQATLGLRRLAQQVGDANNHTVHAVSLQHADRIDAELLHGQPARLLKDFLAENLAAGCRSFVGLPLFFGQTRAITSFVPQVREQLEKEYGAFDLLLADVLYPLPQGDERLVRILSDHIRSVRMQLSTDIEQVVLVDHGSPSPKVTAVRQHIAERLKADIPPGLNLQQAVMERREGPEYDFNGPLLQQLLRQLAESGCKGAVVSMLFLLPGKHAGVGGDVYGICQSIEQKYPGFTVLLTPLVSEHPLLVEILLSRLRSVQI